MQSNPDLNYNPHLLFKYFTYWKQNIVCIEGPEDFFYFDLNAISKVTQNDLVCYHASRFCFRIEMQRDSIRARPCPRSQIFLFLRPATLCVTSVKH